MGALPDCNLTMWLTATSNNTSQRRVIIVDAWPHVGIGHSIRAAALWLRLLSGLAQEDPSTARALRFAVCVPARLQSAFSEKYHEAPACNARVFDPIARRNTSVVQFETMKHLSFAGLDNLRASRVDFAGLREHPPVVPHCPRLYSLLRHRRRVLVLYGLKLREMLQACTEKFVKSLGGDSINRRGDGSNRRGEAGVLGCLRRVHLAVPPSRPLPTCDVGLHLRSMRLDDRQCDLLSSSSSPPPPALAGGGGGGEGGGTGCRFRWRGRRCASETLAQVISCSGGGRRFATADSPHLYASTRAAGWADLDETASVTWNERAITPYPVQLGNVAETAAAFVTLARCTRAIVAPVASHFSDTAALAARVPVYGCCSKLEGAPKK